MNNTVYNEALDKAFKAYNELKYNKASTDADVSEEEVSAWFDRFMGAMCDLLNALADADVYALVRLEFYDNVAQCAYRRGRPINLTELIEKRKVAFKPLYICRTDEKGNQTNTLLLGVHAGEIEEYIEQLPTNKPDEKPIFLPLRALYDLGLQNTNEEEDLSFLLLDQEGSFGFSNQQLRFALSGKMDRESFVSYFRSSVAGDIAPSDMPLPFDFFKGPSGQA